MQQLERQVVFLYRHLGLNPNLTGSDPGQPPVFSSPAAAFGTPAAPSDGRHRPGPPPGRCRWPGWCPGRATARPR
jgi:hypothetical protein